MNNSELNDDISGSDSVSSSKPLKKLVRINKKAKQENTEQAAAETVVQEEETAVFPAVSGIKRKAAENTPPKRKKKKKKSSAKDAAVKAASIVLSVFIIGVMILNMPIVYDTKNDKNISVVQFIKNWQPLVGVEGELADNTMDLQINTDVIPSDFSDGLDLPQLVEGQYSVLFLGFDEELYNTDVMWVCQFDIAAAKLNILQIPRDTGVPDYTSSPSTKFNSVYSCGDPNKTPVQRVVDAVQENFGIPIDAYITTACYDIVDMVDLVGGIPMTIDSEIMYEADKIIPAGDVVLSGAQAEWFVRFRREWMEGDIGRMQNQRRFMAAAMQKLMSIVQDEGRMKLYSYMKTIYDNEYIYTNMSLGDISMLADFASTLSMENVQVNMVPGEGTPNDAPYVGTDGKGYSIYSIHKQETLDLLNEYYRPYQRPLFSTDTTIIEYITDHNYTGYDDTGDTLDDLLGSSEPLRR